MIGRIVREAASLVLFMGPLAVALLLVMIQQNRIGEERKARGIPVAIGLLCAYIVVLAIVTLAPPPISRSNGHFGSNVVPLFYSARCFVPNPGQPSTTAFCLESIIGNFVLFFPLGFLLPFLLKERASFRSVAAVAIVASVSIELLQYAGRWVGNPRWSDVDDVIFNVIGAMVGFGVWRILSAYGTET